MAGETPLFQPRVIAIAAAAKARQQAAAVQKRKLAQGSYQEYYRQRHINVDTGEDPRLALLQEEWFAGKDYLDIGCNTGKIPWQLFRRFRPRSVLGIDVDVDVIRRANEKLFAAGARDSEDYSDRVDFRWEDFVAQPGEPQAGTHADQSYDVISCLSVTKWVHLNRGDEGLKRLFREVYRLLRPGGCFLLEPQPWKSYKKRKNVSETTARNFAAITLRPDRFSEYLVGEVGFVSMEQLGVPEGGREGYRRPLYRLVKGGGNGADKNRVDKRKASGESAQAQRRESGRGEWDGSKPELQVDNTKVRKKKRSQQQVVETSQSKQEGDNETEGGKKKEEQPDKHEKGDRKKEKRSKRQVEAGSTEEAKEDRVQSKKKRK